MYASYVTIIYLKFTYSAPHKVKSTESTSDMKAAWFIRFSVYFQ